MLVDSRYWPHIVDQSPADYKNRKFGGAQNADSVCAAPGPRFLPISGRQANDSCLTPPMPPLHGARQK